SGTVVRVHAWTPWHVAPSSKLFEDGSQKLSSQPEIRTELTRQQTAFGGRDAQNFRKMKRICCSIRPTRSDLRVGADLDLLLDSANTEEQLMHTQHNTTRVGGGTDDEECHRRSAAMERADVKLALTDSWELGNVRRRATVDPKKTREEAERTSKRTAKNNIIPHNTEDGPFSYDAKVSFER
ncbi:hypothetical protein BaRGS_00021051, partial [Batillaria attramentaria]